MLEKWKSAVDNKKTFGALLTDLSKAFDCLIHDLLLAKLNAYGFSLPALRTKNKDKFQIQFMGKNLIRDTPRINIGTSFV